MKKCFQKINYFKIYVVTIANISCKSNFSCKLTIKNVDAFIYSNYSLNVMPNRFYPKITDF